MGYILPCLDVDSEIDQFETRSQRILVALVAYFCATLFFILLVLTSYNMWKFGYKESKWRVWSLSLFYSLATICLILRIWVNITVVCVSDQFNLWLVLMPAVFKICIGLEQIMVVVEITLKLHENNKA